VIAGSGVATTLGVLTLGTLLSAAPAWAQSGGLTELPPRAASSENLLANPGFEAGANGGLTGWTAAPAEVWSIDGRGHSGRASLRLSGADRAQSVPSADQAVTLERGTYTLEGWVKTDNVSSSRNAGVRLCLDGRPRLQWWKCTDVASGTADWKLLRLSSAVVTDPGQYRVTVGAYGAASGTAWFDDISLTTTRRPALEAFLLYPNFRGMLFDDRSQTVRLAVTVARDAGAKVRVSLLDEGDAVRAAREYPASGRLVAELDAGGLPYGTYRVRAQLLGARGDVVAAYPDYRVVRAPAGVRERYTVWYDERNVTYLRGRPTFVLGLYNTTGYSADPASYAQGENGWGDIKIAQAPINMLINYWLGGAPIPALEAYMGDLSSRGIYYLHTVNFYHRDDELYAKLEYPAAKAGEDALNRWVASTLGRHRGLAGFYTADERPAEMVPKVFRQYRTLREAAPGTVAYAVLGDGWEEQAPMWRDAVDVLGLDPYPITQPAGQNDLAMVGRWTRLGQDAVQRSRPVWMVLQYFPLTTAGGWPTYDDLRTMSWMAIVDGARGLFYWSFGARGLGWVKDPRERERHWQDLVRVTREIKALEPVLLAPDAALVQRESSGGAVRVLGKRAADGTRYLFAYNSRRTPIRVTWTLADAVGEVVELGPDRSLSPAGPEDLTVEFGPYEVKRFRLR
jgi:hypothetical protein